MHGLGDRWERGDASVALEHFPSAVLRGRLLGLARGWGLGARPGRRAACPPGEQHHIGLIAFGLALRSRGRRIVFLASDTTLETVAEASDQLDASVVVLSAVSSERVKPVLPQLRELAGRRKLALGAAAESDTLKDSGVLALGGDPVAEATRLTTILQGAQRD